MMKKVRTVIKILLIVVIAVSCREQEQHEQLYYYFPEVDTYMMLDGTSKEYVLFLSRYPGHLQERGNNNGWNTRVFASRDSSFSLYLFNKTNIYGAPNHDLDKIRVQCRYSFFFWIPQWMDDKLPYQGIKVQLPPAPDGRVFYTDGEGQEQEAIRVAEERIIEADPADENTLFYLDFPYELFPLREDSEDVINQITVLSDMSGFVYKQDTILCAPVLCRDGYYYDVVFYVHPKLPEYLFYYTELAENPSERVRCNNPSCILVQMPFHRFFNVMDEEDEEYKHWRYPWVGVRVEKTWKKTRWDGYAYDGTMIRKEVGWPPKIRFQPSK